MDEAAPSIENADSFTFKAETKQLLNILIHSLYKDKEVFLRELLSNASDALNRLRFERLTNQAVLDADAELCIHVAADKQAGTITIRDSGVGMTREELIENLGTIAQSGARKFLEAAKEKKGDFTQVIGQFGVGFYSVFMVAEWVRVTSRSYQPEVQAATWLASGDDHFQVAEAERAERGTTIEIKLKADALEFADEYRLREIIRKHSDYIGFPIYMDGAAGEDGEKKREQVNKQSAIWRTPKADVSQDQYKDFYRQMTLDFEEPLLHLHFVTDAPVQIYSVLFIPGKAERAVFSLRKDDGLKLYSRNILIDEYSKELLPEYLRFVQGVVDSEDLPLNVSRETFQASGMMARLRKVLSGQVVKELESLAKNDPDKYALFWKEFGGFLKQGIATNQPDVEKIHPLLRFRTSTQAEALCSLEDYCGRMPEGQKFIYFILGEDPKSVLRSPHLDYFKAQGTEVLLLTDPMDAFMLMGLHKFKDFELKNVAQEDLTPPEKPADGTDEKEQPAAQDITPLLERFKQILGERVADVRSTERLSSSVARLVEPEGGMNQEMQKVYRYLGKEFDAPRRILELNPAHEIITSLMQMAPGSDLERVVIEQIYDSALLVEGLHPDPSSMVARVQELMLAALAKK